MKCPHQLEWVLSSSTAATPPPLTPSALDMRSELQMEEARFVLKSSQPVDLILSPCSHPTSFVLRITKQNALPPALTTLVLPPDLPLPPHFFSSADCLGQSLEMAFTEIVSWWREGRGLPGSLPIPPKHPTKEAFLDLKSEGLPHALLKVRIPSPLLKF